MASERGTPGGEAVQLDPHGEMAQTHCLLSRCQRWPGDLSRLRSHLIEDVPLQRQGRHGLGRAGGAGSRFPPQGQIVRGYRGTDGVQHGYLLSGGQYTTFDDPLSVHGGRARGIPEAHCKNRIRLAFDDIPRSSLKPIWWTCSLLGRLFRLRSRSRDFKAKLPTQELTRLFDTSPTRHSASPPFFAFPRGGRPGQSAHAVPL